MVNFRKFAGYGLVTLFVLLLVAAIAVPIGFRSYLHSEAFRLKIGAAAGQALKAEAEIQPPRLAGSTAYTDGFQAHGSPESAFRELKADQIRADFNWHGLLHRKWQIDEIAVEKLEVDLADHDQPRSRATPPPETEPAPSVPSVQSDTARAEVAARFAQGDGARFELALGRREPAGWRSVAGGAQSDAVR